MKRLLLLLLLIGPLTVTSQAPPTRAMTFNIRYGTASDGDHVWPNRREHVIATIRDFAPHILGLQEALRFQLDELLDAMPQYVMVGLGREDGKDGGEFAALLIDRERFAVVNSKTHWLSDTPGVPGSHTWGNNLPRVVTIATLHDRADDQILMVYNTHFDHESQPSRVKSAEYIVGLINAMNPADLPVIVMGDLNADEQNEAVAVLLDSLRNAFRENHPDAINVGTFNSFRGDSTGGMIDHLMVSDHWGVAEAGIDRRRFGRLWASDHFAVWARITRP